MQSEFDYKRYAVLYVDDELMALKYFEKTFGKEFHVITASSAAEGMEILKARGDEIGVLLTDQRMPGEKGVELLQRAKHLKPRIVRMLITAYADFGVTVDAVNMGNIFRYVAKPMQVEDMRTTLMRAVEFYAIQTERDDLLTEKLSVLHNVVIADRVISLGVLAAGLNHHLNNAFSAVQSFLHLAPPRLREDSRSLGHFADPAFWSEFYERVLKQAKESSSLLGDSLFDGDSRDFKQNVQPGEILDGVLAKRRDAFTASEIGLLCNLGADIPGIQGHPGMLARLFELLLEAERRILSPGATVTMTMQSVESDWGMEAVQILVADDGGGLPTHALRAVFDPLALTESEGPQPGLSLLVAFLIVYHHGGTMKAVEMPGEGVTYVIELPVVIPKAGAEETSSREFISQVLVNDDLWDRLLSSM